MILKIVHSSRTVSKSLDTEAAVALPEYPLGLGQEGEKDEMEETPRGGREWLGSSGLGECSRELLLRCFFHLARRFWNQTWHTIIIYTYEPNAVCWPISPRECHFS